MSVLIENSLLPSGETATQALIRGARAELLIPLGGKEPEQRMFSRFLAKMCLEAITKKVYHISTYEEFVLHEQFDPIRNWARYGKGVTDWPYYVRRLYPEDGNFRASQDDESFQVLFEFDLLLTDHPEMFFTICIFGVEFTINAGAPDLDGYEAWLTENSFASPLYFGKNQNTFWSTPMAGDSSTLSKE